MENAETVQIRLLEESDPPSIAAAFKNVGWNKPETQYQRYLHEQVAGTRMCFVAIFDGHFAGYVTVNWRPAYAGFADLNIPEIQDLNVLTTYRRKVSQVAYWTAQKLKQPAVPVLQASQSDCIRGTKPLSVSMRSGVTSRMLAALRTEIASWTRV